MAIISTILNPTVFPGNNLSGYRHDLSTSVSWPFEQARRTAKRPHLRPKGMDSSGERRNGRLLSLNGVDPEAPEASKQPNTRRTDMHLHQLTSVWNGEDIVQRAEHGQHRVGQQPEEFPSLQGLNGKGCERVHRPSLASCPGVRAGPACSRRGAAPRLPYLSEHCWSLEGRHKMKSWQQTHQYSNHPLAVTTSIMTVIFRGVVARLPRRAAHDSPDGAG